MTLPQKENGYTAIANEIMDALCGIRISGEARQCLDFILRKTYGFNKKEDQISLSQFCKVTKINKPCVIRAIKKLINMNIVIKKDNKSGISSYIFNKQHSQWTPLSKKITNNKSLSKKITPVIKKDNKSLSKKIHTKVNITKDNITKDMSQKKFSDESDEMRLSKCLFSAIQKNNPIAKEPDFQKWAKEFDLILRVDKRDFRQVNILICFVHGGSICLNEKTYNFLPENFWMSNILSPQKLRKHFEKLAMLLKQPKNTKKNFLII